MATIKLPQNYESLTGHARRLVREEYVRLQGGNCHYCKAPLSGPPGGFVDKIPVTPELFPPGFFNHPVHLHHCHATGLTLGAVHSHCNAVLWQYHGE